MSEYSKETVIKAVRHYTKLGVSRDKVISFIMIHFGIDKQQAEECFEMA